MALPTIPVRPLGASARGRYRWLFATAFFTLVLVSWGSFVTSIEAGMAVPDWPHSFGTMNQLKTGYNAATGDTGAWWQNTGVLAEHGHRLWGMVVGLLTLGAGLWAQRDERRAMRRLGVAAVILVGVQGVLGGVRVTENSVLLALVHACTAQVFFSLLVGMTLASSGVWRRAEGVPEASPALDRVRRVALALAAMTYVQIVFGAVLRHLGQGIQPHAAATHVAGAFAVVALVFAVFVHVQKLDGAGRLLTRASWGLLGLVGVQFALGIAAYAILLTEVPLAIRSGWQVFSASAHLVVGALLMATAVTTALLALRRPVAADVAEANGVSGDGAAQRADLAGAAPLATPA